MISSSSIKEFILKIVKKLALLFTMYPIKAHIAVQENIVINVTKEAIKVSCVEFMLKDDNNVSTETVKHISKNSKIDIRGWDSFLNNKGVFCNIFVFTGM